MVDDLEIIGNDMSEGTEPVLVDNGLGGEGGVVELDGVGGGARGGGEGLD